MSSYIKFELKDGTIVYIETTETPKGSSGLIPGGRAGDAANQKAISFDKAVEGVTKMASVLVENLRAQSEEEPQDISISFGLKASADLGSLFVSRGSMEANYNVSVRWQKKDHAEDKQDEPEKKEAAK